MPLARRFPLSPCPALVLFWLGLTRYEMTFMPATAPQACAVGVLSCAALLLALVERGGIGEGPMGTTTVLDVFAPEALRGAPWVQLSSDPALEPNAPPVEGTFCCKAVPLPCCAVQLCACVCACLCVRVCMHLPVPHLEKARASWVHYVVHYPWVLTVDAPHGMAQSAACCEAWETEGLSEAAVPLALKDDGAALYLHDIAPAERAGVLLRSSDYMRRYLRTRTFSRVFVDA